MIHHVSHWELESGTKNLWRGLNSLGTKKVVVVKDICCWTLDIEFNNGNFHVSSHNTRYEAMRAAEVQACWEVDEYFCPTTA